MIEVANPLEDAAAARAWLAAAGETELEAGLEILNRALHAYRLVMADPHLHSVGRSQALVARLGFGAGEQVSDGLWTEARELLASSGRQRRAKVLQPQARLAGVLTGRERSLVCEELVLRSRLDLEHSREREAALQLLVALDAALAELPGDPVGPVLTKRIEQLTEQRAAVVAAAQTALAGPLSDTDREAVSFTLGRIEAALRARAFANE